MIRRLFQAQLDFVTAALRLESGAAIRESEYKQMESVWFVQPGDDQQIIDQKRRARAREIAGLQSSAGPDALQAAKEFNIVEILKPYVQDIGGRIKGFNVALPNPDGSGRWVIKPARELFEVLRDTEQLDASDTKELDILIRGL